MSVQLVRRLARSPRFLRLGLTVLLTSCRPAGPPRDDLSSFPVVQAWRDCAPWDGPAVRIVFSALGSTGDSIRPPYLTVSLWKGLDSLQGKTWRWATVQEVGAASLCRTEEDCQTATAGAVTLDRGRADSALTGKLQLEFADRPVLAGRFRAAWRERRFGCG